MVNYSNGKIYKIVCDTTNLVYIGSTTEKYLSRRLEAHKQGYRRFKEGQSNRCCTSSQVLEANTYSIILLELVDFKTKDELVAKERYYIETIPCVNKVIPLRTIKEYREANKEKISAQNKKRIQKYKEAHKEQLSKPIECECGGRYSFLNKGAHLKTQKHVNYVASNI